MLSMPHQLGRRESADEPIALCLHALRRVARGLGGGPGWVQAFAVPEDVRPGRKVLDPTDQFVPGPLIERSGLEVVGEVDGLRASTRRRLGLRGGKKPSPEPATSQTWVHPEVLQLAAVTPGPPADAGDDLATFPNEDRQLDRVTQSRRGRRRTTDLRFNELDVERVRIVLDVKSHSGRLVRRRPSAR